MNYKTAALALAVLLALAACADAREPRGEHTWLVSLHCTL